MPKKKFEEELCVYCCERYSTIGKGDHVFARGFFPNEQRTLKHNPIIVPACEECQTRFHNVEEYLISLFPLDICSVHPSARKVSEGPITRSLTKGQGVWKSIIKSAEQVSLFLPSGTYWKETVEITTEMRRYEPVFRKIMRGLYYFHIRQRFSLEYDFAVFELDGKQFQELLGKIERVGCDNLFSIGSGTILYKYCLFEDDPLFTEWLIAFYSNAMLTIGKFFNVKTRVPYQLGDMLELTQEYLGLKPGRYLLISRDEQAATLCIPAIVEGQIHQSPFKYKVGLSILTQFRKVGHIDIDKKDSDENSYFALPHNDKGGC